jgi:MtN3 and saliva related transmembrane protein
MIVRLIGLCAATLTMFSFVPQVIKIYRSKSAKDVSFTMLVQFSCGATLWTVYGIFMRDGIIILANVVTLATLLAAIFLHYKYENLH